MATVHEVEDSPESTNSNSNNNSSNKNNVTLNPIEDNCLHLVLRIQQAALSSTSSPSVSESNNKNNDDGVSRSNIYSSSSIFCITSNHDDTDPSFRAYNGLKSIL
jgi:hypothetical protein